jgi:transketolase
MALTRQGLPPLDRGAPLSSEDFRRGGYVVRDAEGDLDVVVVATGSEVPLALDAARKLAAEGVGARVVSVPSLDLLRQQDDAFVESLVPHDVPAVAVEAGLGESLRWLVGRKGLVYGMKGFGASAPWKVLAEHFGFTPDKLSAAIRTHLGR